MESAENSDPTLAFFVRVRPAELLTRPPLSSSLQSLETCFFLLGFGRYPHALVSCAAAIESSIKAMLRLGPDDRRYHASLVQDALAHYPVLRSFDPAAVATFRRTRDRIVHYGFSPRDDDECAALLLRTGFRFLDACYAQFFGFSLADGFLVEFNEQVQTALDVFDMIEASGRKPAGYKDHFCFDALGHFIRWYVKPTFTMGWEEETIERAVAGGHNLDFIDRDKSALERHLQPSWPLDCPICPGIKSFICQIDFGPEDEPPSVRLGEAVCVECGLHVHREVPFLIDRLCRRQLEAQTDRILKDYGFGPQAGAGA